MAGILGKEIDGPSVLGAATANPMLLRQLARQRAANPRQDPLPNAAQDWEQFSRNLDEYLAKNFPIDSQEAVAKSAFNAGMGAGPLATVFHGSPFKFDKFDLSKIGTGEGAQAYGHGLYFAESPKVARNYRDKLSDPVTKRIDSNSFDPQEIATAFYRRLGERGGAMHAEKMASSAKNASEADAYKRAAEIIRSGDPYKGASPGNLYKVDLPDDQIAKMLDWDKPLSQQPAAVQEALRGVRWNDPKLMEKYWDKPASDFYRYLERRPDSGAGGASKTLKTFGIPGIRYLDGGSRGQGAGTSNFVVFDDQIPKIIGRE